MSQDSEGDDPIISLLCVHVHAIARSLEKRPHMCAPGGTGNTGLESDNTLRIPT